MTRQTRPTEPDPEQAPLRPKRTVKYVGGGTDIHQTDALSTEQLVEELQGRFPNTVILLNNPFVEEEGEPAMRTYMTGDEFSLLGILSTIPQSLVHELRSRLHDS